jgi:hypothetical protein
LQADLKTAKSKLKLKNVVTVQQEKLLDERAATLDTHVKEFSALKDSLAKANDENEAQRRNCDDLKKKLDECKAIIEDNNHGSLQLTLVIEWLHKQLNDDALGRPIGGNYSSKPPTGYSGGIDLGKYATQASEVLVVNHSGTHHRLKHIGLDMSLNNRYLAPLTILLICTGHYFRRAKALRPINQLALLPRAPL